VRKPEWLVRPTPMTRAAMVVAAATMSASAAYLLARYSHLPWLLPVHFKRDGFPNGWQYKTYWRVLLPVFVQAALAIVFGATGMLLLSRPHGDHDADQPDVKAAAAAAEAVALLALIWIVFQAYAGIALATMWQRERAGLGAAYNYLEFAGLALTVAVSIRAHRRMGRPLPRPFVAEHWRFGQLYKNASDPALFVPTRTGNRWTLNFGRPLAAALMGVVLAIGIVGPVLILVLLLR